MHLTFAYIKVISFKIYMLTDTVRKILSTITQQFSPSSFLTLHEIECDFAEFQCDQLPSESNFHI